MFLLASSAGPAGAGAAIASQNKSSSPAQAKPRPRMVVLPLHPAPGQVFDGSGLALHMLLSNTMALHSGFKEFWFGWRVKKLFPHKEAFKDYLRRGGAELELSRLALREKIDYWLKGHYERSGKLIKTRFTLAKPNSKGQQWVTSFTADPDDGLLGFRRSFLSWLDHCGFSFPQEQVKKIMWWERTSLKGLDLMGRALEAYYLHVSWGAKGPFPLAPFDAAVSAAPQSYQALNQRGWALYKNQRVAQARLDFEAALRENQYGLGALSGLIWCDINQRRELDALRHGEALAVLRGDDPLQGRARSAYRLAKAAEQAGRLKQALPYYQMAAELNPGIAAYHIGWAGALAKLGQSKQALAVLEKALKHFPQGKKQKALFKKMSELSPDIPKQ